MALGQFRKRNPLSTEPGLHPSNGTGRFPAVPSGHSRADHIAGGIPCRRGSRGTSVSRLRLCSRPWSCGVRPAVAADDGLEVTTPYPAVAVAPGSKVSFDLTVSSTRTANVGLALTGVPTGWTASLHGGGFVVDGVAATPGQADGDRPPRRQRPGRRRGRRPRRSRVTARGGGAAGRAADLDPRRRRRPPATSRSTTTTPTLTGASDATFTFDADVQERHGPGRDGLGDAATGPAGWDVTAELTGQTQAASTVVEAGADPEHQRHRRPAETTPRPASTPSRSRPRPASGRSRPTSAIEITGSYSMTLATPDDLLSAQRLGRLADDAARSMITNTGTAPITEVDADRRRRRRLGRHVRPRDARQRSRRGAPGTVTATITPSGEAVAGDYVITFNAQQRPRPARRHGPDPLHGRDVAALGVRRDRHHRR